MNAYLYSLLCSISLCVMSLTVNKRLCRDKLPANAMYVYIFAQQAILFVR